MASGGLGGVGGGAAEERSSEEGVAGSSSMGRGFSGGSSGCLAGWKLQGEPPSVTRAFSLRTQIPIPSVPTFQPSTPVPERLEAVQRYIRELQYPPWSGSRPPSSWSGASLGLVSRQGQRALGRAAAPPRLQGVPFPRHL